VHDPSSEDWKRVQRYASWMRRVHLDEWSALAGDTLHRLRLNSPADGWFPALQDLSWCIAKSDPFHIDIFFSPHLKKVSVYLSWSWRDSEVPHDSDILPAVASIISLLPTSTLQSLLVGGGQRKMPWGYLKDSLSSIVLRCGPSLIEFSSTIQLSDAAANYLIHLPHLRIWRVEGPPPTYSASPLPSVFPPLTELTL